ncbi:hypothetical protein D3C72_613650 [compost metagenome]
MSETHDEPNGLEPSLSDDGAMPSGLEPAIKPNYHELDGISLSLLATLRIEEEPFVIPTCQPATVVLGFGDRAYRYELANLKTGTRHPLTFPPDLLLAAVDASGRYYLLGDDRRTLVRYTADLQEEMRIPLRGQRDVTIGRDGNIYTWLFKSLELEAYDPAGHLLRVLDHIWAPYSLAVDEQGTIWLGEASNCHVVELDPRTGDTLGYIDPKEDFTAENLFTYTYAMQFDRTGNLWTFNGQGDVGMTIISPDKTKYIRFASKDLGAEYQYSEPVPSPWNDEVYVVSENHTVSMFRPTLLDWKDIVPDINQEA